MNAKVYDNYNYIRYLYFNILHQIKPNKLQALTPEMGFLLSLTHSTAAISQVHDIMHFMRLISTSLTYFNFFSFYLH